MHLDPLGGRFKSKEERKIEDDYVYVIRSDNDMQHLGKEFYIAATLMRIPTTPYLGGAYTFNTLIGTPFELVTRKIIQIPRPPPARDEIQVSFIRPMV